MLNVIRLRAVMLNVVALYLLNENSLNKSKSGGNSTNVFTVVSVAAAR
jgi:hypothetical protein